MVTKGIICGVFMSAAVLIAPVYAGDDAEQAREDWHTVPFPDQSEWSKKRLASFAQAGKMDLGVPRAVVKIPSLNIAASVYSDRVPLALERGAAWVDGTAVPGGKGNIAIAGHRDSFFRALENVPLGTLIELATASGIQEFQVTSVAIVDALDTTPLDPEQDAVLTLITCHPFRYVGYAPDRYIVRASIVTTQPQADLANSAVL
jgi:sortase A